MNNRILYNIFEPELLNSLPDQWGIVSHCPDPQSIAYATTLTPAVIKQAAARNIDLLVTHHDSWDFMREEQHASFELLEQHKISHIWCHTPLDRVDFGTAASLLSITGCQLTGIIAEDDGRIGELSEAHQLSEIRNLLNGQLSESPCREFDAKRLIRRIACVPGAGAMTGCLAEALAYGIDLCLTGETSLYLLTYATFHNISVLIYSHNYTEILGTQNLARKIADQMGIKTILRLDEPHY